MHLYDDWRIEEWPTEPLGLHVLNRKSHTKMLDATLYKTLSPEKET